jgi:hypothetical protein
MSRHVGEALEAAQQSLQCGHVPGAERLVEAAIALDVGA